MRACQCGGAAHPKAVCRQDHDGGCWCDTYRPVRPLTPKKREQAIAAVIQSAVYGWSIPMLKIPEIYKAGAAAAGDGPTIDTQAIIAAVIVKLELVAERT